MSLFKQLLLLITAIFLVIFAVNFMTSVYNTRSYLQIESEIHAQDTATSLGVSLSPHMADETDEILLTLINAVFDRGYYREIKLVNMEGKVLVQKTNPPTFEYVPDWFIRFLPMETATAETELSSGWNLAGKLYVTIHPGYGYLKLYEQASYAFRYSVIALIIFTLLLYIMLRFVLYPLKKIEQLARDIAEGQFGQISPLPWTTEIKSVSVAMNFMSQKIEQMIANLNAKLDKVSEQLQLDDLTGLKNKGSFQGDMKNLFMTHAEGYIFFIRLDNLGEFAKTQGSEKVDNFLKDFAGVLNDFAKSNVYQLQPYRFYGSEFALIAKSLPEADVEMFGGQLSSAISELGQKYDRPDIAHIGIVPFDISSSIPGLLEAASQSYEQARLIGANAYSVHKRDERVRDVGKWLELLERVIKEKEFTVNFVGQVHGLQKDTGIVMEEAFAAVQDEGEPVSIGAFISIAEKYSQIVNFDMGITDHVVSHIARKKIPHAVSINLSMASVRNPDFRAWLGDLINTNHEIADRVVLSITAYSAAKDLQHFEEFIGFVHEVRAKVMLKRYETEFISLDIVKRLKPDYLRLAREVTSDISENRSKRLFVETMKEVSDLLDVKVIAESVTSDKDFDVLKEIGIYGASR